MNRSPSLARWRTLEPLIDEALALPAERRSAFVDAACGDDAAMRGELAAMLVACERFAQDDGFLGQAAGERYASLWVEPAGDERLAAALADQYALEEEVGRGGMAVVYRAWDVLRQRRVALKVLRTTVPERAARRFRREIELSTRLQHPRIVPLLEAGESAGRLWFTMPLVEGETLGARLRRADPVAISDVIHIIHEIADALSYAHDQGVIHRDLKPDNILLEGDRVFVADFGIAKALVAATTNVSAVGAADEHGTTTGVRVGTPRYMAPEQIAGDAAGDHRIDLYALGVIAYQLITGTPPFGGASRQALIAAHLAEAPPPLTLRRDGIPPQLERLVMRLLAKRASDRPDSAADVRAELEALFPDVALTAGVRRTISEASMSDHSISAGNGVEHSPTSEKPPVLDVVAGRYRIEQHIAAGGMATVFVAQDLKHGRRVAVKVLHESLAHTIGIQRFLREIEVIAGLQHPHLLTLIDSGDVDGLPYYVMPYLEAQSLRETITAQTRLSFADAVRITQEVADGLAYAHKNGVVHRDIKPSNILMSGGHAVVADFGIATALQRAGAGRLTGTGMSLGSPTYMSPEQAAGERDVDARSDIYSVACVLYEMIAGVPPIDSESMQQVVTRKLTDGFTKLHEHRADVPPPLEAAIHRALAADRNVRFSSIEEFSQAIALPTGAPRASRRALVAGIAAGIVAIAGGAFWFRHERAIVHATQQVALVNDLAMRSPTAAFALAEQILPVIPSDATLRKSRPLFTDFLRIVTLPAGARVSLQRTGQPDSAWRFVGETPIESLALARAIHGANYRIRIERSGFEPREVSAALFVDFRPVGGSASPLDTLRLDSLGAHPGMLRITGPERDGKRLAADYYIGKNEVTNREYAQFVAAGGYTKREYWTEPMVKDGRPVEWQQAMTEFRDRSGSPGPSTWFNGTYPHGQEAYPVGGVSYYEAAAYARFARLRLPTETHWRAAATVGNRVMGWTYVAGSNLNSAQPRRVHDGSSNPWGLYDVAGNVREWCVNPLGGGRLALGGGWEDAEWLWTNTLWRPEFDRSPSNGLRLVALSDADSAIAALSQPVPRPVRRDFRGFKAVSDGEFAGLRRMFDYDRRALDWRVEAEGVTERLRWQKVSFTAAYGGERMLAYVYLPKNAAPPFEPVVLWPPGGPNFLTPEVRNGMLFESLISFIPQNGRALVLPVFQGSLERDSTRFKGVSMSPDTTTLYRDLTVQWVNDLRRTIDYLETRADMKADRVGYYGVSWGGHLAALALAMEPRVKAAVLNTGGYYVLRSTRPEVNPGNYTPRVHAPILMLSGAHDNAIFPYETSQAPFLQHVGTPAADKKRVAYSASHNLPQEDVIRETLAWFDRYLSGKNPTQNRAGVQP